MPVFLEELKYCGLGLGPKNAFTVALIDLTLMVDISPLLVGQKRDGREASVLGSSLYCFTITEKKMARFPLFPKDKPSTWRLLWGARMLCGEVGEEGAATSSPHITVCLQIMGVWLLWSCSRLCPTAGPWCFPGFRPWVKAFRSAVAKKQVLFSAVGFSGLLFCDGIFLLLVICFGGFCPFLECAVSQTSKECQKQGKHELYLFGDFIVLFSS